MATLKGKGVIAHVNGIALTAGIVSGTHNAAFQSARHVRTSDKWDVLNGTGDCIASYFANHRATLSLTVVPHAADVAGARTSSDAWRLAAGTLITVTDADGTVIDDNYNLLSSSEGRTNNGVQTIDLELEAFEANEVATAPIT